MTWNLGGGLEPGGGDLEPGGVTWNLGTPQTPLKGRMRCWATGVVGKAAKVGTKVGHTPD